MTDPRRSKFPVLYQLNTRILVTETGTARGRPATLDDLPDSLFAEAASRGMAWIWMLGVWQTGAAGMRVSRDPAFRADLAAALPDLREADIVGSPFAIVGYDVHRDFGGDAALARLRERLRARNLSLLVDFVPNHVALDHPWVESHPEYLIEGSEDDLRREPKNYVALETSRGRRIFAHGRDPNYPGWSDTLQLNYRHGGLRESMIAELGRIAARADGVRCDMAMLLEPSVIARTWGDRARPRDGTPPVDAPFWPEAITRIKKRFPDFLFIAEAYWDMEWALQQEGFDFTYDKRLYDRLRNDPARPAREHLSAAPAFRDRCLHFLENHDEPRAAAVFPPERHRAAAVIAFLAPGLRFFYEGQLEGRKATASIHLARRTAEKPDEGLRAFYGQLLECLQRPEAHDGTWRLCACRAASSGNGTWDNFVAMSWQGTAGKLLAVVNFGPIQGQCYAEVGFEGIGDGVLTLTDLLGEERYERDGPALLREGLYLDLPAWGYNIFDVRPRGT
jgi:hypothetical protein